MLWFGLKCLWKSLNTLFRLIPHILEHFISLEFNPKRFGEIYRWEICPSLQDFSYIRKIYMNANIMKTQIFHKMMYAWPQRSLKVSERHLMLYSTFSSETICMNAHNMKMQHSVFRPSDLIITLTIVLIDNFWPLLLHDITLFVRNRS